MVRQASPGGSGYGGFWLGKVRRGLAGKACSVPFRQGWSRYGPDGQAWLGTVGCVVAVLVGLWHGKVRQAGHGTASPGAAWRVKVRFGKAG